MRKQPAPAPKQKYTPEQQYIHTGLKELRSKQPEDTEEKNTTQFDSMATYIIKQISKDYNPWDINSLTEDDVADDIVLQCGRYIRYCESGWMVWNAEDGCWKGEEKAESMVQWIVRHFGRIMLENATEERPDALKYARGLLNSSGINAVMTILKRDKRIVMARDQFDADPEVLNCKGDLHNLRTGEVRPVEPEDYITKSMFCKPAEMKEEKMPKLPKQFEDFIMKVTSKEGQQRADLALWLLFYFGYSLTGETAASIFINCYGGGQNGKSVLLKLMMDLWGDYAAPLHQDIVIENRFASPFLLSNLSGSRLGILADAGEGQFNTKVMKELSTGEPIDAPVKFKKSFTLRSKLKMAIGTNHKITLRNIGKDIKRRLRLVPFDYTVPDDEIVPKLEEKLLKEAPEILRFLMYCARQYYNKGGGVKAFPVCQVIDEASKEYLESQDLVGRWVRDNTEEAPGNEESVDDMYLNFRRWCEGEGIKKIMGKNKFGEHVFIHIKEKKHTNKGTNYLNIRLISSSPPLPDRGSG